MFYSQLLAIVMMAEQQMEMAEVLLALKSRTGPALWETHQHQVPAPMFEETE